MSTDNSISTPWCYMPPEMHFDSPQDLKDAFTNFMLSRCQEELSDSQMASLLLPPKDKFEMVKGKNGKLFLIPTSFDNSFLFRGQTHFYDKCLPTLYRRDKTNEEIFIERLRCCEFEGYLQQLPDVREFEHRNINIDYLGLAQHYGLQTDMIDLTSSIDVALFFAMCNLSSDWKEYLPQQEDKEYIGYIYAFPTFEFDSMHQDMYPLYGGRLNAIGMQPFYRPGSQRGFELHLDKGELFTGLLYSFSYTKQDSEEIYRHFQNGVELWHEDEISNVAGEIKNTKVFSYQSMNICFKRYFKGTRLEKEQMKIRLNNLGCIFQRQSLWQLDTNRLFKRNKEYEAYEKNIVKRAYMTQDGKKKECIDTNALKSILLIKLIQSGCKAPDNYKSNFEYNESQGGKIIGFGMNEFTQEKQTKPNPITKKVDKWQGDWKSLKIDFHRDKMIKLEAVRLPK